MSRKQDRHNLGRAAIGIFAVCLMVGCQASSDSYVGDRAGDYVISKGEIIKVENMSTQSPTTLSDGIALPVNQDGTKVLMRFGPNEETLVLNDGDILVQAEPADWVLQRKR